MIVSHQLTSAIYEESHSELPHIASLCVGDLNLKKTLPLAEELAPLERFNKCCSNRPVAS
jgi:hypothetical protein